VRINHRFTIADRIGLINNIEGRPSRYLRLADEIITAFAGFAKLTPQRRTGASTIAHDGIG
jgi:hypothetical protein